MRPSASRASSRRRRLGPLAASIAVAVVLALALALTRFGSDDSGNAREHLERAVEFAGAGDQRAAVVELKNALQKDPNLAGARLLLGRTYLDLGAPLEARKEIERAKELGSDADELEYLLARATLLIGDFKAALEASERESPGATSHDWLVLRGESQLGLEQIAEARASFEQALEIEPDSQPARRGLARVVLASGDTDAARAEIARAMEAGQPDADTLILKAELELALNNAEGALEAFQQASSTDPGSTDAKLGVARALIALERSAEASEVVEALAAAAPKDPRMNFLRAMIARLDNDLDAAIVALREVLGVVPDHPQSLLLMGQINYLKRDFEQAESMLSRYVAARADNLAARKLLGAVLVELKQPDQAIEILEYVEARTPEDAQMLALMGTAYMNKRDFEKGKAYLDRASKSAPTAAPIRTQLAVSHLATGSADAAVAELEAAVEQDPAFSRADYLLILTHLQSRDFDKALATANNLLEKNPDSPQTHNLIGAAREGLGDLVAARESYEKALALNPDFIAGSLNLARLDLQDERVDEARVRLDGVLEQDPHNAIALVALARLASDAGRAQEGLALLERAREKNPSALRPRVILAAYYLRQGAVADALSTTEEAKRISPDDPGVALLHGRALAGTGRTDEALDVLGDLARRYPGVPDTNYQLALAQVQKGRLDDALASLDRVLTLRPDNLLAKATYGNVQLRAGHDEQALEIARELQSKFGEVPAGFILEGDVLAHRGEIRDAVPLYRRGMEVNRNSGTVLKLYGALRRADAVTDAESVIDAWIADTPGDMAARLARASASHIAGQVERAASDYEAILGSHPDNVLALNNLAWIYHERGDPRALELAERAYERIPDRAEIADTYGWLLVQKGQVQRGLALLDKAARGAPGNGDIAYHRAAALAKAGENAEAKRILEALLESGGEFAEKAAAESLLREIE